MKVDIVLEKPVDFSCPHCHCTSKVTVFHAADENVKGRYESAERDWLYYSQCNTPQAHALARKALKVIDGNAYDYWVYCSVCHNRGAKFKIGEESG